MRIGLPSLLLSHRANSPTLRQWPLVLLALLVSGLPRTARAAEPGFVWLEGEKAARINFQPKPEGVGHPEFLSDKAWLKVSIDAEKADKEAPADGVLIDYTFAVAGAAGYEIWMRIGYEFVRSPFDWRIDQDDWHSVSPEDLTTDLMELSFWTEVAWLKVGALPLTAGQHTLSVRLPKTKDAKGKAQRILFALDAVCLSPAPFHPCSFYQPGQDHQSERDREAARHVFRLPDPPAEGARSSVQLKGLWEVCRHDEDLPAPVASPITNLPPAPRWTAITVPGDKNQRDDLVFAHRLWYRTRVHVPTSQAGRSFFLVFPQNNLNTTVYVNGRYCGFDKNPFARVQIDVSEGIRPGAANEIWVGIRDAWYAYSESPTNPRKLRRKFNLPKRFFGEGFQDLAYPIWNHPQSGLLVTPELVAAGSVYVSDVFVKPSVARKELAVEVTLKNTLGVPQQGDLILEAIHQASEKTEKAIVAPKPFSLGPGAETTLQVAEKWADPMLWWPDDPNLYRLRTTLTVTRSNLKVGSPPVTASVGHPVDWSDTTFGFREWTTDGPHFRLNGIKWHGWADCFTAKSPDEWVKFHRDSHQTTMRFWGVKWQDLPPEEALDFFDRQGVVCRRSGMLDGEAIGSHAMEQDPELQKLHNSKIKVELMLNWLEQVVAQVKGERNHPSVNVWSLENEWLYINCLNLHGGSMDEFEAWVKKVSDAVRAADPTRLTMTDGGGANKDQSMPVHGNHYVFDSGDGVSRYPALAYDANPVGGGRGRWVWDQRRPRFIGEDYFANGINPFDYAYFGGEATFQGKAQAYPAAGLIYRMLMEGYRWAEYGAWHFWLGQESARDQYGSNPLRAVFCRQWDWTFGSGQKVPRTFGIFNDTRFNDAVSFTRRLTMGGREILNRATLHKVPAGENEKWDELLEMPPAESRTEGQLVLTLSVNGQEVFRDAKAVTVLPLAPRAAPSRKAGNADASPRAAGALPPIALLDPQASISPWFEQRGVTFSSIADLAHLPAEGKILVVAPDALDERASSSSTLAAWASAGRRVIVLEQTHPLKYQGLPCDMNAEANEGRTAFIEDSGHPVARGLKDKDFFTWGGDEVVYRNAYEKPSRGAKSLIQCHRRLKNSALVEVPVGDGLLLLSQLMIGAKLQTNAVAQTLLLNLLDYAAAYRLEFRPVVAAVGSDPLLARTLDAIGLAHSTASDALAALDSPGARIAIVHASPAHLKQLAENNSKIQQFLDRGGYLVLNGLTPEGLANYNKLVGFEHMIRKFGRERVALASPRHPLTAGLTTGDVVMRSGERIFGWTSDEFVANDVFSFVVDYRDVAPFAQFEDDFKKLMVNGMVSADAWKYIVNLPVEQCVFKLTWPKPQTFEALTWVGNTFYFPATQAEFLFDGKEKAVFDLLPNNDPQDFEVKPARTAGELSLKITRWDEKPNTRAISGLDNLFLYAQRPPDFLATVKPLLNIGGLMYYQRGQGGIVLMNLLFKETEVVPENALKKRAILATVLRNLKAPFSGGRTVIAGARLRYEPVDLSKHCTAYRNERGWFGDAKFTLAGLPGGRQTFAGVPCDIFEFETSPVPTVIMIAGRKLPNNPPAEVRGIPLERKADALFFLHTARLDQRMNDDDRRRGRKFELARYIVTYADGQTNEIPVYAEIDVDDYRQKAPRAIPGAQIAWTRPWEGTDQTAVAYLKQWTNPRPDVPLKSLDFVLGKDKRGVPVLLALTTGNVQ